VRAIQDLRKDANFELADRITLGIHGADDVIGVFKDYVTTETLATSLVQEVQNALASKTIEIGKRSVRLSVEKSRG